MRYETQDLDLSAPLDGMPPRGTAAGAGDASAPLLSAAGPSAPDRRDFRRAEDGGLLILSLFLMVTMLLITGMAIDFARQEERRVAMQSTLDRASLAAADLSQNLDPKAVVDDYLTKAGMAGLTYTTDVKKGNYSEWRSVEVKATDKMQTTFLDQAFNIKTLNTPAQSKAIESIGNVEISMVLDISGSMNDTVSGGTRISKLQAAANKFVTKMFTMVQPPNSKPGKLAISVVPYNQQVTLGTTLGGEFALSTDHTKNTCADFTSADFSAMAIYNTTPLQRTMYGNSFDYKGQYALGQGTWSVQSSPSNILNCPNDGFASVLAFESTQSTITTKINNLVAGGDTAIDVGAKWGLALLDPAAQGVVTSLIGKLKISGDLAGRPFAYDDKDTMKVMVLMTDGQNTRSYSTKPAYRTGFSGLITDKSDNKMYYYDPNKSGSYKWYNLSSSGGWQTEPCYCKTTSSYNRYTGKTTYTTTTYGKTEWQYEDLWASYSLQYVIETWLGKPYNNATALYNTMAVQSEFTDKDGNLEAICDLAKDKTRGVLIFTIAVDAPTAGANVLKDCATSEGTYYNVDSSQLDQAFSEIAANINSLRLTN
ncbi:TadE/TadG family type IV pilus assembly protein [Phaeovulum sp. W22_SRMD_FR3]|uniref:TadE/TadG family type IV pilus assembly protein n=1 Tax=Phaeovulum sp. W22_SRMD_FR3 TaxID=3240274 RepID=UPI003F9B60D9